MNLNSTQAGCRVRSYELEQRRTVRSCELEKHWMQSLSPMTDMCTVVPLNLLTLQNTLSVEEL